MLRRGERRGLLRPLLADMCRLRDDLLKQAATLPAEFDAAKAADLLRSYAETIETHAGEQRRRHVHARRR